MLRDCPELLAATAFAERLTAPEADPDEDACTDRAAFTDPRVAPDADEESADDALAFPESEVSAQAKPGAAPTAIPTPRATAKPPTRPM